MKKIDTLLEQARAEKKQHDDKLKSFKDRRAEAEHRKAELSQKLEDYDDGTFEEYVEIKAEVDKLSGFIELLNKQEKAFTTYKPEAEKDCWTYMKQCTAVADELRDETVKKVKKHVLAIIDALEEEKAEHDKLLEVAYSNLVVHNIPDSKVDNLLTTVRRTSNNFDYMQLGDLRTSALNFKERFERLM